MALRTRLIIAFLLLSVVPLSAVTFFTYRSWVHTFEAAAQREASQSALDIGRRMERITSDVGRRMDRLFDRPSAASGPDGAGDVRGSMTTMLGDTAALVDRVEFRPRGAQPPPSGAPPPPAGPGSRAAGPSPDGPRGRGGPDDRGRGGRGRGFGPPPEPPAPPVPPEVIVIDVQQALAEARRAAGAETIPGTPDLGPLLDESLRGTDPASRAAEARAAAREVQLHVEGRRIEVAIKQDGKVVGTANATLNLDRTLQAVFGFARRDQGEIPFAIDTRGVLHNPDPAEHQLLESFGAAAVGPAAADGRPRRAGEWLIVARKHPSGLIFGIARPIGESLREIRRASVRNLSLGLLVIAVALVGIVPISHGMTRHLASLSAGVRQLAAGDFRTRVAVRSRDEFGALAGAFNQMAEDLERHQALAVERERLRRELELSRQIQVEMLPRAPLRVGAAEITGISIPAREVGGDFFNYFALEDGRLALLVGDVSGKGVGAALLMANVQATLRARVTSGADLATLAASLDRDVHDSTPGPVYLTLFLGILDPDAHELRYVNAGHNPQFVLHAGGGLDAMPATGLPIALLPGQPYEEARVHVGAGDLIFFYTDGLTDTENEDGDMFGIERLQGLLTADATPGVGTLLERVEGAVRAFRGDAEPFDDATMMLLRMGIPHP